MLTLQAATARLETLDFEENYLIGLAMKSGFLSWLEKWQLGNVREKRRIIYKNTFVK